MICIYEIVRRYQLLKHLNHFPKGNYFPAGCFQLADIGSNRQVNIVFHKLLPTLCTCEKTKSTTIPAEGDIAEEVYFNTKINVASNIAKWLGRNCNINLFLQAYQHIWAKFERETNLVRIHSTGKVFYGRECKQPKFNSSSSTFLQGICNMFQ